MLMLQGQYPEWDTACMALEHGFELYSRVGLPDGFYQSREMSGKPWKPQGGEMYIFSLAGEGVDNIVKPELGNPACEEPVYEEPKYDECTSEGLADGKPAEK